MKKGTKTNPAKGQEKVFAGFFISKVSKQRIELYSEAYNIRKSGIFLNMLDVWENTIFIDSLKHQKDTLVHRLQAEWISILSKGKESSTLSENKLKFSSFINSYKDKLIDKGIDERVVSDILKRVKQ